MGVKYKRVVSIQQPMNYAEQTVDRDSLLNFLPKTSQYSDQPIMSETNDASKNLNLEDDVPKVDVNDDPSSAEIPNPMPSLAQEEAVIKKKYGGLLPRKTPLISKDHDRAFFDSADWALGKGSQKSKGPLEALRPKLQPSPHQQARSRRSAYAPADELEGEGDSPTLAASEDQGSDLDLPNDDKPHSEDEKHTN